MKKKTYIITKVVSAKNISEAIKLEKGAEIEAIEVTKSRVGSVDTYAMGFQANFPGENTEDDEDS